MTATNDTTATTTSTDDKNQKWYHINRHMLSSKFAYFFEYAKEGSHWPYLVLFYVSIGLDPAQAGLVSGLRFIGGLLGGPICGWIADRTGRHRVIAMTICWLAAATNLLQPAVSLLVGDHSKNTCFHMPLNVTNVTDLLYLKSPVTYFRSPVTYMKSPMSHADYTPTTNMKLFYTLMITSLVASFFDGTSIAFVDSGVLQNILNSPTPTDIGKQRYFGPPGVGAAAFISAILIDHFPIESISCYTGIFVNYFFACTGMAVTFAFLFKKKPPREKDTSQNGSASNDTRDNNKVNELLMEKLKRVDTWIFLSIVFFNGMALALAFSFSFLYLKEMNSSSLVMGVAMAMNGSMGALFFLISDKLISILGSEMKAMGFSCFWWCVRYLLLAFMNEPFHFPLICMLNGMSCSIFVAAYVRFIKKTFPASIFTVFCGISGALYNSGGYLVANIVGGIGYKNYGAFHLFVTCGIACGAVCLLTFLYAYILERRERREFSLDNAATGVELPTVNAVSNVDGRNNDAYTNEV